MTARNHSAIPKGSPRPKPPSKAAWTRRANLLQEALSLKPFVVEGSAGRIVITINNLETCNELNRRELSRWEVAALRKAQHKRLGEAHMVARRLFLPGVPARATFVRLAQGTLDELVNLPASLKRIEDSVCEWFGVDDGPGCPIVRRCEQRLRRVPGVEISLEWGRLPEVAPRCRIGHPGQRVSCCLAAGHKGSHWDDDGEVSW